MAARATASLLLFLLLASSATAAIDILQVLAPYKDYSTISKLLKDTKIVDQINGQKKATVLVVADTEISPLSTLTGDVLKNAVALHALPDYYDPYYFQKLSSKTATVPTLLNAAGDIGMLRFSQLPEQLLVFGSAVPGSLQDSELNKVVAARPNELSVLEISKPILPKGIQGAAPATTVVYETEGESDESTTDITAEKTVASEEPTTSTTSATEDPANATKAAPATEAPAKETKAASLAGRTAARGGVALGLAAGTVALLTL